MKKIKELFFSLVVTALVISCSGEQEIKTVVDNNDGSISIVNLEKTDAISYNKKVDGFENVTVLDGKKSTDRNLLTISLKDYANHDLFMNFSCDIKVVDKSGADHNVQWVINEPKANLPTVAAAKLKNDTWTKMSGEIVISIGKNRTIALTGSGFKMENVKIYIKNLNVNIAGDGIGSNSVPPVNWMDAVPLKSKLDKYFDYFGLAVNYDNEFSLKEVQEGVARHADCITWGNELKPDFIFRWAKPVALTRFVAEDGKSYDVPASIPTIKNVDTLLQVVKDNGLKLRGHVLVWHSQTPEFFFHENYDVNKPFVNKATMNAREEWYIKYLLEYIANWEKENNNGEHIIFAWDVVNEACSDSANAHKTLRDSGSNWYTVYKDDSFIINAFRYANKYAPKDVLLVYNDYNSYAQEKTDAILRVIDAIQATPDARIDAVGMQSHIKIDYPAITGSGSFEAAVQKFVAKGLDVQITELDIANGKTSYNPLRLKSRYKELFEMFIRNRKTADKHGISGITIWGLTDNKTWLNSMGEYKGYLQYPLLFTETYNCKSAFYGIVEAVDEAGD